MSEVVVHFNSKKDGSGRRLVAVALEGVRGVVIGAGAKTAIVGSGLVRKRPMSPGKVPDGIRLEHVKEDGTTSETALQPGEDGPQDVCYWVAGDLFCWE